MVVKISQYDGIEVIFLSKGGSKLFEQIKRMYGNRISDVDTANDGRSKYENGLVMKKGFTTAEELDELAKLPDMTRSVFWLKEPHDNINYSKINEINAEIKAMDGIMSIEPINYVFEEK